MIASRIPYGNLWEPAADLVEVQQWREQVLKGVLLFVLVLGAVTAIPSVALALQEGQWSIAVVDVLALLWVLAILRVPYLDFNLRAWNFLLFWYLFGVWFFAKLGPVGLMYVFCFPVFAALLLGFRAASFALLLNGMSLFGIGYFLHPDVLIFGYAGFPFMRWLVITLNFSFISTLIVISCSLLLNQLEKSLAGQMAISASLEQRQQSLHSANEELHLIAAALAHLNEMVMIIEIGTDPNGNLRLRVVFVNEAFERRTGYRRDELLGKSPRLLEGEYTQVAELERIRDAMASCVPVHAEMINYTKSGEAFWMEADFVPLADTSGRFTHWVAAGRDISERKRTQEHINRLAYFDVLTGLPNRRNLLDRITLLLATARCTGMISAVLFIDLDHFKYINDARGHQIGDAMLKIVARRLCALLRDMDVVARVGGDEFVILLANLGTDATAASHAARVVSEKIRRALVQPCEIDGLDYSCACSIGACLLPKGEQKAEDLLREADTAMYRAKARGRNQIVFYEASMQSEIEQRLSLERDLSQAIGANQLQMYLQTQVDCRGEPVGGELLMRWQHPQRGAVSPALFIPVAEESGLILELGDWAMRRACQIQVRLERAGFPLALSVNVSPKQFRQIDFIERVRRILRETGASARRLIFEVTEGLLIERVQDTIARMHDLSALGIRFSIDDFGTGYSSMSYLKRLPLYELKIDKSFVQDVPDDPNGCAIVQSMLSMAGHLGLRVVAEGVETQAQADFLIAHGCDAMQGYLYARPMPVDAWLAQQPVAAQLVAG